ncbi:DUF1348 family protein [Flavobacteriaceae bacterium AU392]|nr:DUF1348 family protein [Flavobacteriaceae bacterium]RKM82955.1 DUF1348 family protein [Flavobacteriaceae bacterium AU392]
MTIYNHEKIPTITYGNENWEFDQNRLMLKRYANINDLEIKESKRKF